MGPCCEQTDAAFEVGFILDQGQGVYSGCSNVDGSSQLRLCHTFIIDVMPCTPMPNVIVNSLSMHLGLFAFFRLSLYRKGFCDISLSQFTPFYMWITHRIVNIRGQQDTMICTTSTNRLWITRMTKCKINLVPPFIAVESIGYAFEGQNGYFIVSVWTPRALMAHLTLLCRCHHALILRLFAWTLVFIDETTWLFLLLESSCVYRIWQYKVLSV